MTGETRSLLRMASSGFSRERRPATPKLRAALWGASGRRSVEREMRCILYLVATHSRSTGDFCPAAHTFPNVSQT
jgi:hypothetical protein